MSGQFGDKLKGLWCFLYDFVEHGPIFKIYLFIHLFIYLHASIDA